MKNLFKIHIIKNFIIAFTLTFTLAFTLTLTLVIISTSNANANMFNKFKKGFYFEKYSTAEEAKAALLELHPIGSDVGELVKTLERAGAEPLEDDLSKYRKFKKYNSWWERGIVKIYYYRYSGAANILNPITWAGSIDIDKNNKIIDFSLSKQYTGL